MRVGDHGKPVDIYVDSLPIFNLSYHFTPEPRDFSRLFQKFGV